MVSQAASPVTETRGCRGAMSLLAASARAALSYRASSASVTAVGGISRISPLLAASIAAARREPRHLVRFPADISGALARGQRGGEEPRVEPAALDLRRDPSRPRAEQVASGARGRGVAAARRGTASGR